MKTLKKTDTFYFSGFKQQTGKGGKKVRTLRGSGACSTLNFYFWYLLYMLICSLSFFNIYFVVLPYMSQTVIFHQKKKKKLTSCCNDLQKSRSNIFGQNPML